jgi:hypothetical protein
MDYYFSESLSEVRYYTFPKKPVGYSVAVSEYIERLKKPVVLMGHMLNSGEAHNYFKWNRDMRCVNLFHEIDDFGAIEFIKKHNINYIVVTPVSKFIGPNCTLGKEKLSDRLKEILVRIDVAADVIVYKVNMSMLNV